MNKLILSALAVSTMVSPLALSVADAQVHRTTTTVRERPNGTVVTRTVARDNNRRAWRKGQRFDRRYAPSYGVVDYRRYRGLRAPPRGYHWVRSGNDAVLVGITSGIIASVLTGAIR